MGVTKKQQLGGDLSRLRQLNAQAVVGVLRGESSLTLTEISRRTGLSRASTEDVVRELAADGWVAEVAPATGTVGRPARRFSFRADGGRVLGVDVGTHKIRAIVADLDGNLRGTQHVTVTPTMGRVERLTALDEAIDKCLAVAQVRGADIWATGVATPGLVDGSGQVRACEALPEWVGVNLAGHVGRQVRGRVLVENDCRLAALAEWWRGAARYADNIVFVLAGPHIGTGLIINGRLHHGSANAAGEIGALPAIGWIRAQEHLQHWMADSDHRNPDDGALETVSGEVFAAARAGEAGAQLAVEQYVRDLGIGVAALILTLDPQLVVLGGGFSRSADVFLEPLRRELGRWCVRTPELLVSSLGDEGVAFGAVRLALDHIEEEGLDTRRSSGTGPLRRSRQLQSRAARNRQS